MANLLNKLRMLDAAPKKIVPESQSTKQKFECFHSQTIFPHSLFADRKSLQRTLLESLFDCSFPASVEPEDLLFLDTETTGLSGGAGTIAFQIGVGYFSPSGFVVEQFLMHDYPEEPEMLRRLSSLMQRSCAA